MAGRALRRGERRLTNDLPDAQRATRIGAGLRVTAIPGGHGWAFALLRTSPVIDALRRDQRALTMFSDLRRDRERAGMTVEQAASRFGVSVVACRQLEAGEGWPSWETYEV